MRLASSVTLTLFALSACSDGATTEEEDEKKKPKPEVPCESSADCAGSPDAPYCEDACSPLPAGWQIGLGDGSVSSVTFTVVLQPDKPRTSTDLAFNPSIPDQLWVVNALDDSVHIVDRAGAEDAAFQRLRDPAASHFMDRPPAIAFGSVVETWGQTFGVCGDNDNGGNNFMGPALFPSDLSIFTVETGTGLGSHLDMLHSTSFCRGIAHLEGNVYFVFNSDKGSLDKYDFVVDHGPGQDDHSDGQIWRYVEGQVAGVDGVPSHLAYDVDTKLLYVADTGNQRVAVLDTVSGAEGDAFLGDEPARRRHVDGAVLSDFVPAGTLQRPSGIEVADGVVFVSDEATSVLYAFGQDGELLRTLETGLPAGSLAGITLGITDEKLYFVDKVTSVVYRIDPIY